MRNTWLHKRNIQNVIVLPGGCGKAEVTLPPPQPVLTCWPSWCLGGEDPRGNFNSLSLSVFPGEVGVDLVGCELSMLGYLSNIYTTLIFCLFYSPVDSLVALVVIPHWC